MWADRVLAIAAGDPERGAATAGYSPLALAYRWRSGALLLSGHLEEAGLDAERALAVSRLRAEPEGLPWTLALLSELAWFSGQGEDTLAGAQEAVRLGEETANSVTLVWALKGLTLAYLALRQPKEAADAAERGLAELRTGRAGLLKPEILACLALARLDGGDGDAIDAALSAVDAARTSGARVVECFALLASGRARRSAADLDAALALVDETQAFVYEPFIREELGRLRGDEQQLREAVRRFEEIGATGHALRLGAELHLLAFGR